MIAKTTTRLHRNWLRLAQPPMPYSTWFGPEPSMTDRSPSGTGQFSTSVISKRSTGISCAKQLRFHPSILSSTNSSRSESIRNQDSYHRTSHRTGRRGQKSTDIIYALGKQSMICRTRSRNRCSQLHSSTG